VPFARGRASVRAIAFFTAPLPSQLNAILVGPTPLRDAPVTNLSKLFARIESHHHCTPAEAAAEARMRGFERASGFPLPFDLRAFYLRFDSATLFGRYDFLPLDRICRTGAALGGPDWFDSEPAPWFAFCSIGNGDHVGIDLATNGTDNFILDCDHDNTSSRRVIARSFTDFLAQLLTAKGDAYYLDSAFRPIAVIDVPYRPPLAWLREHYHKWSQDPEVGPDRCRNSTCPRLAVSLSVFCRRHHFESINNVHYPFDD
jgi:hypothetical protein